MFYSTWEKSTSMTLIAIRDPEGKIFLAHVALICTPQISQNTQGLIFIGIYMHTFCAQCMLGKGSREDSANPLSTLYSRHLLQYCLALLCTSMQTSGPIRQNLVENNFPT